MFCYKYLNMMQISQPLCFRKFLLNNLPIFRNKINNSHVKSVDRALENPKTSKETTTTAKKKSSSKKKGYLIPPLSSKYISEIQTMTAISVGVTHITWIRFALDTLTVLDWNGKPLPQNFWTALHEPSLLSFAYNTNHSLPSSDLYAMETFSMNIKQWERKVNEIHLLSMLIVLIHGIDSAQEDKTKVVFQEKRVLDRLYEIYLGHERIATTDITESILQVANSVNANSSSITNDNFNSALQISSKLLSFFNESNPDKKEDLSLVFLLALSIIKVHIYQIKNIVLPTSTRK